MARKDPGPRSMVRFVGRVIKGSRPSKHPGFVEPALATLRAKPPSGNKYIHEIKFDGYRVQAHLQGGLVSLWTRGGLDWTKRFPTIAVAVGSIPATGLILDGEVVSATEKGAADFSALQDDLSKSRYDRMAYYAFDILYLDGFDLRAAPLVERKRVLSGLLKEARNIGPVFLSESFEDDADALIKLVQLKENSDSADTGKKIRSLLMPMEYTRLDSMIDVMFTTATDVEAAIVEVNAGKDDEISTVDDESTSGWEFTDVKILDAKRAKIIDAVGKQNWNKANQKKSRVVLGC